MHKGEAQPMLDLNPIHLLPLLNSLQLSLPRLVYWVCTENTSEYMPTVVSSFLCLPKPPAEVVLSGWSSKPACSGACLDAAAFLCCQNI